MEEEVVREGCREEGMKSSFFLLPNLLPEANSLLASKG